MSKSSKRLFVERFVGQCETFDGGAFAVRRSTVVPSKKADDVKGQRLDLRIFRLLGQAGLFRHERLGALHVSCAVVVENGGSISKDQRIGRGRGARPGHGVVKDASGHPVVTVPRGGSRLQDQRRTALQGGRGRANSFGPSIEGVVGLLAQLGTQRVNLHLRHARQAELPARRTSLDAAIAEHTVVLVGRIGTKWQPSERARIVELTPLEMTADLQLTLLGVKNRSSSSAIGASPREPP